MPYEKISNNAILLNENDPICVEFPSDDFDSNPKYYLKLENNSLSIAQPIRVNEHFDSNPKYYLKLENNSLSIAQPIKINYD